MKVATLLAAAAVALAAAPLGAHAHGYLTEPKSRNYIHWSDYCPQCLSAGGPFVVSNSSTLTWPTGLNGLCGDPWNRERKHEAGGVYATGALLGGRSWVGSWAARRWLGGQLHGWRAAAACASQLQSAHTIA